MPNNPKNPNNTTSAVADSNVMVMGSAPAVGQATGYQTLAHSVARMFESSVSSQNLSNQESMAAGAQSVASIYAAGARQNGARQNSEEIATALAQAVQAAQAS